MKKTVAALGLSLFATLMSASADSGNGWVSYPGGKGPGKGKHVVLLAGDEEYRSEEGLPMLAKILSQRHGFECTVLFSVADDGTIVNLADMKPQTTDSHCSEKPVRYVLEMNVGWFAKKGIKAGSRLRGPVFEGRK